MQLRLSGRSVHRGRQGSAQRGGEHRTNNGRSICCAISSIAALGLGGAFFLLGPVGVLLGKVGPRQRQRTADQRKQRADDETAEVGGRQGNQTQDQRGDASQESRAAAEPRHETADDEQRADDEGGHSGHRRDLNHDVRDLEGKIRRHQDDQPAEDHEKATKEWPGGPPRRETRGRAGGFAHGAWLIVLR